MKMLLVPVPGPRRPSGLLCGFLAVLLLVSCGGEGLTGRYTDPRGVTDYEFRPDGRVFISVMGTTTLASYELLEDRVVIDGPEGVTVLRRREDELEGPLGLRLIRAQPLAPVHP